jgi:hypothetical protein
MIGHETATPGPGSYNLASNPDKPSIRLQIK